MISGGARRSTSGRGALITKPAAKRSIDNGRRHRLGQDHGLQQASTAYAADQPMTEVHDRRREMIAEALRVSEQTVALDHADHGQSGNRRYGVAAERAAVAAWAEQPRGGYRWRCKLRPETRCPVPWPR